MKILVVNSAHCEWIRIDYGVVVPAGSASEAAFDLIVTGMGFPEVISAPTRVKNLTITAYLRERGVNLLNKFDIRSFVTSQWIKRQQAELRTLAKSRHREKNKGLQKLYKNSWSIAVSRDVDHAEHLGVLARLPSSVFYKQKEWVQLRAEALSNSGFRCVWCGVTASESRLDVDHIKTRIAYPELAFDIRNLRVLCEMCHVGRHLTDGVSCR